MCGIAAIVSGKTDLSHIHAMTQALLHRGPDADNTFIDPSGTFAVGHTRLSIIDLSTGANQPFPSHDGRYVVVFNGEIYNFQEIRNELIANYNVQFKTHSDTEVVVEAFAVWREQMVEKLEGMFALVIIDTQERTLYLFRDRAGKKPLFYFQSGELIAFASEIKALLQHPVIKQSVKINRSIVSSFLHVGYIPEPATIYSNIFKFPAGHYGTLNAQLQLKATPYWRIQENIPPVKIKSVETAKRQLHTLLHDAVEQRMISDVPLGAFLSGGTDSSIVTAIASKHSSSPLKTFSIGFRESKFDESQFARAVAKHLKTDHTEYILSEQEGKDILITYLKHFDEPFADTSAVPTMLVSKLAREKVTVALTGDGGDELFQGYGAYDWANRLGNPLFPVFRAPLKFLLDASGKSRFQRAAHLLERVTAGSIRSHIFSQEQYFFSQQEIRDELLVDSNSFIPFEYDESAFDKFNLTPGDKQALFDFQYYLKDDLLVKVDRASMFYALECRCPLLDHHIVEFAFSLDPSLKSKGGKRKWLLKELLREYLPNELIDRPKWGFSIPLARWLKNDLRYLIDQYLNDDVVEETGLVRAEYVSQLKKEFVAGKDYLYNRLWVLLVLHKWMKDNQ
ncbi:asparagine synthase (glutamine-hydrolyzing) [Ohtaekwangia sp.]|uniref:asparagine synthase (glutamine-hydrolyzing) n=1 Tax=Ohtaekwangia sp. TaxID=2066019 RepID=UPI002FDE6BA8